ncbi:hypothetical protein [Geodermatophilus bullaregiensis]|uniref:hypothetical protein n=1 Tax=Geodermatophilus bullaregiensis TaxID=1564160 RepID=UPI001958ACD9|nr:hypothetical protein [Geodermatophilus bullaregiensis]
MVSLGIAVLGLAAYGVLTVAARSLTAADFSTFAAAWSLLFAVSGGFFLPLEQETTRAVAARRARGHDIGPAVRRVAILGAVVVTVLTVLLAALSGLLRDRVLAGRSELLAVLVVAFPVLAGLHVVRGALAGTRRLGSYALVLSGEGLTRLVAVVLLAAAGAATTGSLALAVAAAPLLVIPLAAARVPRGRGAHVPGAWPEVTQNLAWLVVASVVAQGLANAGPIVLQVIGPADADLAGRFLAAFVVVRLPLFFTGALQASLLPRLVHAAERRDRSAFMHALGRVLALVGVLGGAALLVLLAAGPALVSLFFGPSYVVARLDMTVLGASSVLLLLAALLQSAVVALRGHRTVALCWAAAAVVFVAGCTLPLEPLLRVEVAYVLASLVVVGALLAALIRVLPAMMHGEPSTGG